jgi:hypothetical protein
MIREMAGHNPSYRLVTVADQYLLQHGLEKMESLQNVVSTDEPKEA